MYSDIKSTIVCSPLSAGYVIMLNCMRVSVCNCHKCQYFNFYSFVGNIESVSLEMFVARSRSIDLG